MAGSNGKRKRGARLTTEWVEPFLADLSNTANITQSALKCGTTRWTVYQRRRKDPDFAVRMDEAIAEACDKLEAEAWRRAVNGVQRDVYQRGQIVGTETYYSDRLLEFLLRAHKPDKYKDRVEQRNINETEIRVAGMTPKEAIENVKVHVNRLLRAQEN